MSIRAKLSILLAVLILSAVGNSLFTFIIENYGEKKLQWVIHTHEVIIKSEKFLSSMTDTETGQRGYLLTGDATYLQPYHSGLLAVEQSLNELIRLTSGNPVQQERLAKIKSLMQAKLAELHETITIRQRAQHNSFVKVLAVVKQDKGKEYMEQIRRILVVFNNTEHILLEKRMGDYKADRAYLITFVVIQLVFFMSLGIFTVIFIKNNLFVPLAMLLTSTEKVERGEKSSIEDILPNNEIGYLLSRFYQMSETIYSNTESLTYQAQHDTLTGLETIAEMQLAIDHAISSGQNIALLFIDLNDFKVLNDSFGHEVGDAVLIEVARRLTESVRTKDTVFRQGGDEFVIVLNNITHSSQAKRVAEHILKRFKPAFTYQGNIIDINLCIGISLSPGDSLNSHELLKFADIAMYDAKQDKEICYKLFSEDMLKHSEESIETEISS